MTLRQIQVKKNRNDYIKWRPLESYSLLGILIFVANKPCFIKLASFYIHIQKICSSCSFEVLGTQTNIITRQYAK